MGLKGRRWSLAKGHLENLGATGFFGLIGGACGYNRRHSEPGAVPGVSKWEIPDYPIVWSWEAFSELDYDKTGCENAERIAASVLSLPVFAQSSDDELQYVAWAIKKGITELK